jgi:hypothetical protein
VHVPPGVLRDLLHERQCRGLHGPHPPASAFVPDRVTFRDQLQGCSPLAGTVTFVASGGSVPSAAAEARWEHEERHAAVRRIGSSVCASLAESAVGRPVEPPDVLVFLCGLIAVQERGGIAVGPGVEWVRPATTWLPSDGELVVARDALGTLVAGLVSGPNPPSACLESTIARVVARLRDGGHVDMGTLTAVLPTCVTVLPASTVAGDAVFVNA